MKEIFAHGSKHLLFWRSLSRKLKLCCRHGLAVAGKILPFSLKLYLARRSSKLGGLLLNDKKFVFEGYLGEFKVEIDPTSDTDRALLRNRYEPNVMRAIETYVTRGSLCVDAGANIGALSFAMSRAAGPTGRVFCFEPGPPLFERLTKNLSLNPALSACITVINQGLSDQPGELFWSEDPDFPGNGYCWGGRGTRIHVTTLDLYFATATRLDFIKIDTEGMEYEVLKGGMECLNRFAPVIALETIMDFETFRRMPIRKMTAQLLTELGYQLFELGFGAALTPVHYPHFTAYTLALPGTSDRSLGNDLHHHNLPGYPS